jgi:hypothetical protein
MKGFFQTLIDQRISAGRCTEDEAAVFLATLSMLPEEQRAQLRSTIEEYPQLIDTLFDNILQKAEAVSVDTMEAWQRVVDDEAKKADALDEDR